MMTNIVINDEYRLRRDGPVLAVADIGANVGVFSLHAATLFPNAVIHCYEPDPRNFLDLKYNVRQLCIKVFPDAVSGAMGSASMILKSNQTSSRLEDNANEIGNAIQVSAIDLAEVVRRFDLPRISLLKLDCEGSEYKILAQDSVRKFDRIVGELHTTADHCIMDAVNLLLAQRFILKELRSSSDGKAVFTAVNECE